MSMPFSLIFSRLSGLIKAALLGAFSSVRLNSLATVTKELLIMLILASSSWSLDKLLMMVVMFTGDETPPLLSQSNEGY